MLHGMLTKHTHSPFHVLGIVVNMLDSLYELPNISSECFQMLERLLCMKHGTPPTHTQAELLELRRRLGDKQSLHVLECEGELLAGVYVLHVTSDTWYTMYLASQNGRHSGALALGIQHVLDVAHRRHVSFLDYGISTKNRGTVINQGLSVFKQDTLCGKPHMRVIEVPPPT